MHRGKHSAALAIDNPAAERVLRQRIEMAIEKLISALDALDDDPDLEPDSDDEDSHDRELDPADDGIADPAALRYFFAEMDRRARLRSR